MSIDQTARCTRRTFLQAVAAASLAASQSAQFARAADVEWLADVQRAPAALPSPPPALLPLLVKPDGAAIATLADWNTERERLRAAWLEFLGPMPAERPPVKLEVLREDRLEGCVRQLVRYVAEEGQLVEGYLLRPTGPAAGRRAGIVALHPTSKESIEEIAGVTGAENQHLGLHLCRKGFVVFCPRCYLWQTPPTYHIDVKRTVGDFQMRHPRTLGMHKMLFDAQRGIDILTSLPDVDPKRIGATGHSLGAKETLYLAAFDERIRAAVASEGGIGFSFTNWADPWYLGPGIKAPDFKLNHHQLLALVAPRAFLILGGESGPGAADGDRTWPYVEAALPVYRLHGQPARIGLLNHRQGHSVPPPALERLTAWLTTYLAD
jgi:hypothetical protein